MNLLLIVLALIAVGVVVLLYSRRLGPSRPSALPTADEMAPRAFEDLYQEGCALINPYMVIDGAHRSVPTTDCDRASLSRGVALLEEALRRAPTNWPALWIIGKAYEAQGQNQLSYEHFKRSYALNPTQPDVAREYILQSLALGLGAEAVAVSEAICNHHPNDAGLLANHALALLVADRTDDALSTCDAALRMAPTDRATIALQSFIRDVRGGKKARPTRWLE